MSRHSAELGQSPFRRPAGTAALLLIAGCCSDSLQFLKNILDDDDPVPQKAVPLTNDMSLK